MRRSLSLCALLLLAACSTQLRNRSIAPTIARDIVPRHNFYVEHDSALTPEQRDEFFRDARELLNSVSHGESPVDLPFVQPRLHRVCDRHDTYVSEDTHPDVKLRSRSYLRSTAFVRTLVDEAASRSSPR